jgi:hypothetical protein
MGVLDWIFGTLGIVRAPNAQLSAGFLAAQQWRLDAIGPWVIEADADNLDIKWRSPSALGGQWVPLDLQFHTDSGTASFDPDERMFELWELFLSRKSEFVRQLQRPHVAGGGRDGVCGCVPRRARGSGLLYIEGSFHFR